MRNFQQLVRDYNVEIMRFTYLVILLLKIFLYKNFLLACKGEEKSRSPFSISGPTSQVFCLGVVAQRLSSKIIFDRKQSKLQIISLQMKYSWGSYAQKLGRVL